MFREFLSYMWLEIIDNLQCKVTAAYCGLHILAWRNCISAQLLRCYHLKHFAHFPSELDWSKVFLRV